MRKKFSAVFVVAFVLLAAAVLAAGCGGRGPTDPTPTNQGNNLFPPVIGDRPPNPDIENYVSADGLVEMYVYGIVPGRDGTIVPGKRAELYIHVIYKGTRKVTILPTVVDDPSENPGRPGRNSRVLGGGPGFNSPANQDIVFGTFSAPVSEDIPFARFCKYFENRLDTCDINIELRWHPQPS